LNYWISVPYVESHHGAILLNGLKAQRAYQVEASPHTDMDEQPRPVRAKDFTMPHKTMLKNIFPHKKFLLTL